MNPPPQTGVLHALQPSPDPSQRPGTGGQMTDETGAEEAVLAMGGERLIRRMLAFGVLALGGSATYQLTTGPGGWTNINLVLFAVVATASYLQVRQGKLRSGLIILSWGVWMVATTIAFTLSGIHAPALFYYPVMIMLIGWLQGRWQANLMCGATIIVLLLLVHGAEAGWLLTPFRRTPKEMLFVFIPAAVLAAILSAALADHNKRQLAKQRELSEALRIRLNELERTEGEVRMLNADLENRVASRTAELEARRDELSASLAQLQQAQTDLVQAGKLASLGALVAGVAHELNTPIGNALVATTTMDARLHAMREAIERGELRRSTLDRFISEGCEINALTTRSCDRAAALVASFKQVAVDRASERRRTFVLQQLVADIVATLQPTLRHETWSIVVDIAPDITCDAYPGPLGQIVTNLIQNAGLHAFANGTGGTLHISAAADPTSATLIFSDDGAGMDEATLAHIFDPFFTTKLGTGGSGLGLSICRNIATGVLGGSLRAESTPGHGTRFILQIPLVAPD